MRRSVPGGIFTWCGLVLLLAGPAPAAAQHEQHGSPPSSPQAPQPGGHAAMCGGMMAGGHTCKAGCRMMQGHEASRPQVPGGERADMQLFQELFEGRDRIRRFITVRPDGVETLTESDDPAVAAVLQAHVRSMTARVTEGRPIHRRDPLFREVFAHADRITMTYEPTARGVRVVETSADPYVVRLIQGVADVVSAFLANGHAEMIKDHPVPAREP